MTETCPHCDEPVVAEYASIPHLAADGSVSDRHWHPECYMRAIVGGLNHLLGKCTCCGGIDPPDPPGMTRREAAIAAVAYYTTHQPPECG